MNIKYGGAKYNDLEKATIDAFIRLINSGLTAKDAVLTLDYWIFVKYVEQFEKLTEDAGFELTERLCVYEKYINSEWLSDCILDKIANLSEHQ